MLKFKRFGLIGLIYAVVFAVGYFTTQSVSEIDLVWRMLVATVVATFAVYCFSVVLKNSSIYDPYWSVQPLVILPFFVETWNAASLVLLGLVYLWGLRLTFNWATTFTSLNHEDWRYEHYRKKNPYLWPLTNLFGIHLMPTLIVYGAMVPAIYFLKTSPSMNAFGVFASMLAVIAVGIQWVADWQMHRFKRNNPHNRVLRQGLWARSRHPNYFGEVLFWFSLFFVYLSLDLANGWAIVFPLIVLALFLFVSVPLMEKRQIKNKPDYADYIAQTPVLLPLPTIEKNRKEKRQIES